jgi:uncharacterized ion transporter superfamily protein YfcC
MIIDGKTIALTVVVLILGLLLGVRFIREFALQIAQENHDAVAAMDQAEEEQRVKKERSADAAAASAFAKVQPILTTPLNPATATKKDETEGLV